MDERPAEAPFFDRHVLLRFHSSVISSDAGPLAYGEWDDATSLTSMAGEELADARTGKNVCQVLVGLLRQSVFGWLAGYEKVNHAERLCRFRAQPHLSTRQ